MTDRNKIITAGILIVAGAGLIAWHFTTGQRPVLAETQDDNEVELTVDTVPSAVRTVIERLANGAEVSDIEQETEDGVITYEVRITRGTTKTDLELDASGKILKRKVKQE